MYNIYCEGNKPKGPAAKGTQRQYGDESKLFLKKSEERNEESFVCSAISFLFNLTLVFVETVMETESLHTSSST